ncbi:MAG TPA: Xaa-Pro peptidase family protein [Candidatus Limnocylindrales bacterium]|nr:Xaa-Pro peptidase family protein [Candidatus Limnocylindrales bacterium]
MAGSARAGRDAVTVDERPTIPAARHEQRLAAAASAATDAGFDALLIGVGADLRYLTGYAAHESERLTMLVVPRQGDARLVVPRLEQAAAEAGSRVSVAIETWGETDDPAAVVARFVGGSPGAPMRIGVSDRLWSQHLLRLQAAIDNATFTSATTALRRLRMAKDSDEIALLRLAARAADRVVNQIAAGRLIGRTEADVSREVRERLVAEGHDSAEFAIVASGPNSASPHHDASDRVIRAGEPIVLDIGGTLAGYGSDITRTLWVTGGDPARGPDEEYRHLFAVLQTAQETATRAVRPGIACEAVDAAARDVIAAEGYGEAFIHRTGHGIGLEGHEEPYLVSGNDEPLGAGMAFSIEPGIYLAGRYGARIEDIVVCGPDGAIPLNEANRNLRIVPG